MARTRPMSTTKLTYADYQRLPDDGRRYEVLDGEVVVSASAGSPHQAIQIALAAELYLRIQRPGLGRAFTDLDCELTPHDIVRPDLLVVLPEHCGRILPTHVRGTPDLAIEILSPGTAQRDRGDKLRRYEAAGTPEVWLVDGLARCVTQFVHDGERLQQRPRSGTEVELAILPGIRIPLTDLW